jgi:undecaprenyl-phosphate 4-deoxy-4-formamido-L-arabinose transferase
LKNPVELSIVIPVYNSRGTLRAVVESIHEVFADIDFEVVLVNDGSVDNSEETCQALHDTHSDTVTFLNLARNFGEHNAVMAGLSHTTGAYTAIIDDDGQTPPEELLKMYDEIRDKNYDVVFGQYLVKHHSRWRNWGSRLNHNVANVLLKKPRDLYLSSFKIMNRFVVDEITGYHGPFPYIDGLIVRATRNLGQIEVEHRPRETAHSNYTMSKLFYLWLNSFLGFSIAPLRVATLIGLLTSGLSLFVFVAIAIDKMYINPDVTVGIPAVLTTVVFFAGLQLLILGVIGEYLGRLFLDHSKNPQYVIRYVKKRKNSRDGVL